MDFCVDSYCNLFLEKAIVVLVIESCVNAIMKPHRVEYFVLNLI